MQALSNVNGTVNGVVSCHFWENGYVGSEEVRALFLHFVASVLIERRVPVPVPLNASSPFFILIFIHLSILTRRPVHLSLPLSFPYHNPTPAASIHPSFARPFESPATTKDLSLEGTKATPNLSSRFSNTSSDLRGCSLTSHKELKIIRLRFSRSRHPESRGA